MIKNIVGDAMHIKFEKDLIAPNIKEFENQFERFIEEGDEYDEYVVEMSEVKNIDSVGITFVIGIFKKVTKDGSLFRVTGCNDDVKSLFRLMNLDDFFDIAD